MRVERTAGRSYSMGYDRTSAGRPGARSEYARARAIGRVELEVGGVYWPFPQEALGNL